MVAPADGNTRIQRPTTPSTPGPVEAPSRPEVAPPAHAPVASPSPATDGIHTVPETVTVRSGESLYLIAARHQIPQDQLRKLNPELFSAGPDASGRARAADGGLIYPGDSVRLRPIQTPQAAPQDASQKVVSAAKEFIQSANPGEHPAPDQLLESARRMMELIPASDPDHDRLKSRIEALTRPAASVEAGGGPAQSEPAALPQPPAGGTANPVGAITGIPGAPTAQPQTQLQPPLPVQPQPLPVYPQQGTPVASMPQPGMVPPGYPQGQFPAPPQPAPIPGQAGWPQSPPAVTPSYPGVPQAEVGKPLAVQAFYSDGTAYQVPISTPSPSNGNITAGTVLPPPGPAPAPGMVYVSGPRLLQPDGHWVSTVAPQGGQQGAAQSGQGNGVAATQTGTQPGSTTPAAPAAHVDPSNPRGKDPHDPKVQAIERFLATAKDSDIVNLVQQDAMKLLTATPDQKARMLRILLEGRTSGSEQQAILAILQSAQDQGESAASLAALDRLEGGAGKGALRLNEDLERQARQQMLATLTGPVPFNEKYPASFYQSLAARMDKADIEALGNGEWLTTMPDEAKAMFIQKLQAPWWWPFGGNRQLAQQIQSTLGR